MNTPQPSCERRVRERQDELDSFTGGTIAASGVIGDPAPRVSISQVGGTGPTQPAE